MAIWADIPPAAFAASYGPGLAKRHHHSPVRDRAICRAAATGCDTTTAAPASPRAGDIRRSMMLKGKTAIVTGSTSGIGLGIASALAAEGCAVMLNGFGEANAIEALRSKLANEHGVSVAYSPANMAKPQEIRDLVADTLRRLGSVDILVNNAGIQHVEKVADFPEERWDAVIAINMSAA